MTNTRYDYDEYAITGCDDEGFRYSYGDIDLYFGSEDWMGWQLNYTTYPNTKNARRFGVGGIVFNQITPNTTHVYIDRLDSSGKSDFLFVYFENEDESPIYHVYSGSGFHENFLWQLCNAIEKYYED